MTALPFLAFLGGVGATFLIYPFWSSILIKRKKGFAPGTLVIDSSALLDPRLVDVAVSGLLDKRLLLPHSVLKKLSLEAQSEDEMERLKGKKGLENFRRLEALENLEIQIVDVKSEKRGSTYLEALSIAKTLDADLLISDPTLQDPAITEGVKIINLQLVAPSFKQPIQGGEKLVVKVQRMGKEIGQGVGYLEDGTMVVINGASDLIGETLETIVLSVKHNTAGRMVFCNTKEEHAKTAEGLLDKVKRPTLVRFPL